MKIALLIATFVTAAASFHSAAAQCPNACTAVASQSYLGTLPANTQLVILVVTPQDGSATEYCAENCTPWRQQLSVSFYGNGTGNCVMVNHNGAGWSNPLNTYSRPGWLTATCGSSDSLEVRVGNCGGLPSSYDRIERISLACPCDCGQ
jgi:hypothetical protein